MVTQAGTRRKEPTIRVVEVQRILPCPLTETELKTAVRRISTLLVDKAVLEEEIRKVVASYRAKLKAVAGELGPCMQQMREQVEHRSVRCEERFIYATGMVRLVRTDTGALVEERPMREGERQLVIDDGSSPAP